MVYKLIKTDNYLLVGSDDNIKRGCFYCVRTKNIFQDEGEDVHCCNGDIRIIAHLPLNGSPILEGVDLLPPYSRHQEDGLDAFAEYYWKMKYIMALDESTKPYIIEDFKAGYNKAREKYKYTENDIEIAMLQLAKYMIKGVESIADVALAQKAKSIVQSLHQYPTEFISDDEISHEGIGTYSTDLMDIGVSNLKPIKVPKTITTAQGTQWVGKYK